MKRRLAPVVAILVTLFVLGMGATAGRAEGAPGPAEGTTGHDRACQVHRENRGKSSAKGLECATFTVVVIGPSVPRNTCSYEVRGADLMPGSPVHFEQFVIGNVAADGTFVWHNLSPRGAELTFSATTSSGGTITATVVLSC